MQLDAFRLHLLRGSIAASARWIHRGLRHVPTVVDIRSADDSIPPNETLHLVHVKIIEGFTKDLGHYCPVLEELHMESSCSCSRTYGTGAGPLMLMAPRLASIRLDIPHDRWRYYYHADAVAFDPQPLPLLADASIRLTGQYKHHPDRPLWQARKLDFVKSVSSFIAFLPNVANLHLSGFTVEESLQEEFLEFPVLHNLKTLLMEECGVGASFLVLTSILRSTTNLEKLGLHQCIVGLAGDSVWEKSTYMEGWFTA
ncbi:MEIOTIC F-BOX protein MOF-like [Lolium perenne]|uniref:MEIOTIC F-BOX protein MOF-like n=1 Tax=Lolium perenne TaxID=4522 RepID=UPI0021F6701E|nr:MEIOTIC F-BOX protein MOF-like [Lolium perenne]